MLAVLIIITIACAITCHYLAKKRGANPVFWSVMGIAFGPLAIPFVFLAKPVNKQNTKQL